MSQTRTEVPWFNRPLVLLMRSRMVSASKRRSAILSEVGGR